MAVLAVSSIFNVVSIIAPAMTPASFLSSIHFPTHSVNLVRNASALLQVASTNLYELLYMPPHLVDTFHELLEALM
ncbi:hypothetical protein BASA62_007315 [Batrachochytrium salamandrivorans]|nr:hypothetical protein BASA62_007315 [Batrachochytrium salamandrivorans]